MAVDRRAANEPPKNDRTDLEVWLRVKGPELLRRQAANIVLGLALLIALGFFLYSRSRNRLVEQEAVAQNAAAAYDFAFQLRQMPGTSMAAGDDPIAADRQQRARDALNAADVVLTTEAATVPQRAIAQLVKADVYWTLANLPERALATTRPVASFAAKSSADYLNDAEAAYTEVLKTYTNEKEAAASALLGLAAIAENRGNFDLADSWYGKTIDDASLRETYREIARNRRAMLADLRKPYVLAGATSQPTTAPATAAAGLSPFITRPSGEATTVPTAPTSLPAAAAPTTAPATQP